MKHQIFAIFDSAADAYIRPFQMPTEQMAIRSFRDAVNDPKSEMHKNPQDYTLFHLGEFEDADARYNLHKAPMSKGNALEFKSHEQPNPRHMEIT